MCEDFGSNSCNSRGAIFARIQLLCAAIEEKKMTIIKNYKNIFFKKNCNSYTYLHRFQNEFVVVCEIKNRS